MFDRAARLMLADLPDLRSRAIALRGAVGSRSDEWCRLMLSECVRQHLTKRRLPYDLRDDAYRGIDHAVRLGTWQWSGAETILGYVAASIRNAKASSHNRKGRHVSLDACLETNEYDRQIADGADTAEAAVSAVVSNNDRDREVARYVGLVEAQPDTHISREALAQAFRVRALSACTERELRRARASSRRVPVVEACRAMLDGSIDSALAAKTFPMLSGVDVDVRTRFLQMMVDNPAHAAGMFSIFTRYDRTCAAGYLRRPTSSGASAANREHDRAFFSRTIGAA